MFGLETCVFIRSSCDCQVPVSILFAFDDQSGKGRTAILRRHFINLLRDKSFAIKNIASSQGIQAALAIFDV